MCEPIFDKALRFETEQFRKRTVEEYQKLGINFKKFPLRHYSQIVTNFDRSIVRKLLEKLSIPTENNQVTVFGRLYWTVFPMS
jgi:hypothetical protein